MTDPVTVADTPGPVAPTPARERLRGFASRLSRPGPGLWEPFRDSVQQSLRQPSPGMLLGVVYVAIAIFLTHKLLAHPVGDVLAGNPYDQYYFEWQIAYVQHALFHFQSPLFSNAMNAPTGFNLEANPQIILPAAVLSPITWLSGAQVSFALLMVFNFAATAITWRWFLIRNVVRSETAAFVGGLFLGFGPSMMTHSLAHPNLAGQWLIPVIADRLFRLRSPDRQARNGVILGVLIAAQLFVGEELLFLTAIGLGLFVVCYAVMSPSTVRREGLTFLKGAAVAIGTAGVLLAYPLAFQFGGPQSFKGIPFSIEWYSADLKSYLLVSNLSIGGGNPNVLNPLAAGNTEQAALMGTLLIILVVALALWCVRSAAVRAALLAVVLLVLLSLGPTPVYDHKPLPSPFGPSGIWQVLRTWPLFSSALPIRMALAVSCFVGVLLAVGIDKAMAHRFYAVRGAIVIASVVALIPLTPRVFDTTPRQQIPAFFTDGSWKSCLPLGRTIVTVPLPTNGDRTGTIWAAAADDGFDLPQGPVFVPASATNKQVQFGTPNMLWTAQWLTWIHDNGGTQTPSSTPQIKAQIAADMKTWNAGCVVMADNDPRLADMQGFLDPNLGPGQEDDGVWVWRTSR